VKLGIAYNIFDGEEILPFALKNLREFAEFIVVVYQTTSNYGNTNHNLLPVLKELKEKGLIDMLYEYEPNIVIDKKGEIDWKSGTLNEVEKRDIGLKICRANNCDTYMTLDCDELYDPKQFEWAIKDFETGGYDTSFTLTYDFYKLPTMQLLHKVLWYQPLFYKIKKDSKIEMQKNYPVNIDRTKMIKTHFPVIYKSEEIIQYHYAYVRNSLKSKVNNSSARSDNQEEESKKIIDFYDNWSGIENGGLLIGMIKCGLKEVENKFNIIL
jgi:hypothetical protein